MNQETAEDQIRAEQRRIHEKALAAKNLWDENDPKYHVEPMPGQHGMFCLSKTDGKCNCAEKLHLAPYNPSDQLIGPKAKRMHGCSESSKSIHHPTG